MKPKDYRTTQTRILPILGVASLQLGGVIAFDASVSAWLSCSVIAHKSTVFKRTLLSVNALGVVPFTSEDVACVIIVDPLLIRIAHFKLILITYCELALNDVICLLK